MTRPLMRGCAHGQRHERALTLVGMPDVTDSLVCPTCGATPVLNALMLTDRSATDRRVCQALYDCPACGARLWRWNDRPDSLTLWTDDYWPESSADDVPREPRTLP